jgi:predicted lipid-binding transport protein (Tim44 family)
MSRSRSTTLALVLAAGFAMLATDMADARLGGGGSFGSRGGRTYSTPPQTNTAPKVAPIEKSMTQKGAPTAQSTPGASTVGQASPFGGWRGLLMGGLIAAGLASIFGLGALASVLGFVLQAALIAGAVYLLVAFIRSRNQPALARASAQGTGNQAPRNAERPQGMASFGSAAPSISALTIGQTDLDTFEKMLGDVQTAYSREDVDKLGAMTTPEMLSYFAKDLSDNAKQGVRNEVSDVKLLQGDLSEAWREDGTQYATVAMRFSLVDATVDRATGQVVSGDPAHPTEATELWTFRRDDRAPADGWQLSAIQQAA